MHVLITAVGERTEHWIDLFEAIAARPDIELTVVAADVPPRTERALTALAGSRSTAACRVLPCLLSERRTGHMASIVFRPGSTRGLAAIRPDVVHVIGEAAYLSTRQVIRMRDRYWPGVPISLYAAQNTLMRLPFPFPHLENFAYRSVACAFPITPAALHLLRAKDYHGPARIVPLGVDTDRFRPAPGAPHDRFTVGFVGRMEPHKGVADLLAAAELSDADVLIVGGGSQHRGIAAAAARRPGRVRLRSWVGHDELPGLLRQMDVLVLPAVEVVQRNVVPWIGIPLREQFGRVLVEAMACGVPVVGSDVGEIPHVIGPAGLVFPAGDVTALAERLTRLRDDPALARDLAVAGRCRAERHFAWSRVADTLCLAWHELSHLATHLAATVPSPRRLATDQVISADSRRSTNGESGAPVN